MYQAWDHRINQQIRFIHPIKTAGTSIGDWMQSTYAHVIEWTHQAWDDVPKPETQMPTFAFTVFRNPWDRIESLYLEFGRIIKMEDHYGLPIDDGPPVPADMLFTLEEWNKGFEYFVDMIADEEGRKKIEIDMPEGVIVKGWRSQLAYWPTDHPLHVLSFRDLHTDWKSMWKKFDIDVEDLPHAKNHPHPESLHTARTRSLVEQIWKDDVSYFASSCRD